MKFAIGDTDHMGLHCLMSYVCTLVLMFMSRSIIFQSCREYFLSCFWFICNSCTIGCPPVRGDNPRALASGLSYVQVDKHGITILYHLH